MGLKIKIAAILVTIVFFVSGISMLFMEYSFYTTTTKLNDEIALKARQEAEEAKKQAEYEAALEAERKANELNYDEIRDFYNGRAVVRFADKYGVIDEDRKLIVEAIYDEIADFTSETYTKVKKDGKWGYISRKGTVLIPTEYYYCGKPYNNIVAVGNNGRYGYVSLTDGSAITGLIYDKVEDFGKSTVNFGKVILNQKFGYVDATGQVVFPIESEYIDETAEFVGLWNRTEVHSGEAAKIEILNQQANTFEFSIDVRYYMQKGLISGVADIVLPNVAEYVFEGKSKKEVIRFERIDDYLQVSTDLSGNLEFDKDVKVIGKYVMTEPEYTNANTLHTVFFKQKTLDQILAVLGEELYEEIFLECVNNGLYKTELLNDKALPIRGTYYYFYIPTTQKAFKMLIAKETGYIYFQARNANAYTYKTDDESRRNRPISAVSFDEVLD